MSKLIPEADGLLDQSAEASVLIEPSLEAFLGLPEVSVWVILHILPIHHLHSLPYLAMSCQGLKVISSSTLSLLPALCFCLLYFFFTMGVSPVIKFP